MTVVDLNDRRPPAMYTVRITHHWDGTIEVWLEDLEDSERSREAARWALARAAELFPEKKV